MAAPAAKSPPDPVQGTVVTKAALKAAERLDVSNKVLAAIIGVSEATVSRMRSGRYMLQPGQKAFELAVLFTRLYRSLDAIVGGDEVVARAWLRSRNINLDAEPLALLQSAAGLVNVINYLDARRAVL